MINKDLATEIQFSIDNHIKSPKNIDYSKNYKTEHDRNVFTTILSSITDELKKRVDSSPYKSRIGMHIEDLHSDSKFAAVCANGYDGTYSMICWMFKDGLEAWEETGIAQALTKRGVISRHDFIFADNENKYNNEARDAIAFFNVHFIESARKSMLEMI